MLPRCGSAHRPGGLPWQRTLIHVSSRRSFWIYAPERACTRVIARFTAESAGPLPFGQWVSVQHNRLGAGTAKGGLACLGGTKPNDRRAQSTRARRRELEPPHPTLARADHDPPLRGGPQKPGEAGRKTRGQYPDGVARGLGRLRTKPRPAQNPWLNPRRSRETWAASGRNQDPRNPVAYPTGSRGAGTAAGQTNKH